MVVKGNSQIWDKNKFINYKKGSFKKEIEIERNVNKWGTPKTGMEEIDKRNLKFRYMDRDDRTCFFNKIPGVHFNPDTDKTELDNCLDFLAELEKMGKLAELNEIIK